MEWLCAKLAAKVAAGALITVLNCKPRPILKARKPYKVVLMVK